MSSYYFAYHITLRVLSYAVIICTICNTFWAKRPESLSSNRCGAYTFHSPPCLNRFSRPPSVLHKEPSGVIPVQITGVRLSRMGPGALIAHVSIFVVNVTVCLRLHKLTFTKTKSLCN